MSDDEIRALVKREANEVAYAMFIGFAFTVLMVLVLFWQTGELGKRIDKLEQAQPAEVRK